MPANAVTALSYGSEVADLRGHAPLEGRVLAVLRKALYLQSDLGHIVCVTPADAEDGPLTLRVRHLSQVLRDVQVRPGAPFAVDENGIRLYDPVSISWSRASAWLPTFPAQTGSKYARGQAAAELTRMLANVNRDDLIPSRNLIENRLKEGLCALSLSVHGGSVDTAQDAALGLLGLGEGLTPSGDDIVMGWLAMLVWQANLGLFPRLAVTALAGAISEAAPTRTNVISARLLYYAARGLVYAPAMQLGAVLLAGYDRGVEAPAHRLLTIGSSSGADMASGLLAGLLYV